MGESEEDNMKTRKKKGFTLAELLIVVAIIGVLVAIAIPVFNSSLEKSREATDLANIRGAYAEVTVNAINDETTQKTLALKQIKAGWDTATAESTLNSLTNNHVAGTIVDGSSNTALVEWLSAEGCVKITFNGGGSGSGDPGTGGEGNEPGGIPALHSSGGGSFTRGTVIIDDTGACVIMQGMYGAQQAYNGGAKVSELVSTYSSDAVSINPSDIKTSTEGLAAGGKYLYYVNNAYYYIPLFNQNEPVPASSWVSLIQ